MCYRHSLTCQRALCNGGKRQGDSQRVINMDLVHGSSTLTAVHSSGTTGWTGGDPPFLTETNFLIHPNPMRKSGGGVR